MTAQFFFPGDKFARSPLAGDVCPMRVLALLLLLLLLMAVACQATDPDPQPSGPQVPVVPPTRLGTGGDCSSSCAVCGCNREVDVDRGGGDVGANGAPQGGGTISNGHGAMPTEEACCQFCRKISTAVLYKWESAAGHNCWCSSAKGPVTAQGAGTDRRSGSFAPAECAWGWSFVIALSVASVLYVGGGIGFAVKTRGAAPGLKAHPHVSCDRLLFITQHSALLFTLALLKPRGRILQQAAIWEQTGGLVRDGLVFVQARITEGRGKDLSQPAHEKGSGGGEASTTEASGTGGGLAESLIREDAASPPVLASSAAMARVATGGDDSDSSSDLVE